MLIVELVAVAIAPPQGHPLVLLTGGNLIQHRGRPCRYPLSSVLLRIHGFFNLRVHSLVWLFSASNRASLVRVIFAEVYFGHRIRRYLRERRFAEKKSLELTQPLRVDSTLVNSSYFSFSIRIRRAHDCQIHGILYQFVDGGAG
jgi:hypothetical protein